MKKAVNLIDSRLCKNENIYITLFIFSHYRMLLIITLSKTVYKKDDNRLEGISRAVYQ